MTDYCDAIRDYFVSSLTSEERQFIKNSPEGNRGEFGLALLITSQFLGQGYVEAQEMLDAEQSKPQNEWDMDYVTYLFSICNMNPEEYSKVIARSIIEKICE